MNESVGCRWIPSTPAKQISPSAPKSILGNVLNTSSEKDSLMGRTGTIQLFIYYLRISLRDWIMPPGRICFSLWRAIRSCSLHVIGQMRNSAGRRRSHTPPPEMNNAKREKRELMIRKHIKQHQRLSKSNIATHNSLVARMCQPTVSTAILANGPRLKSLAQLFATVCDF